MRESRGSLTSRRIPRRSVLGRSAGLILAALLIGVFVQLCGAPSARADEESKWLTGKLLVATPLIRDPRFERTVIYMIEHDAEGAMGLIVNRPIGSGPIAALLDRLDAEQNGDDVEAATSEITVHYGGPVEGSMGFILHTSDYSSDGTIAVDDKVAMTARADVLRDIAAGRGPRRSRLMFGYAGWGPGQLESEMARNSWIVVPADENLIFDDDYDSKWERAFGEDAGDGITI